MPRVSANSPNAIYEVLKDFWFLDETGTLLPWGDDVWKRAADAMQGKMSRDYMYLYLSKNRNDVFNRIHSIDTLEISRHETTFDTIGGDSRDDSNWSMDETSCTLPALRKTMSISTNEWNSLKSHIVEYKKRSYEVLVIGWTDALYDMIWSHLSLPCPFSFKNAKFNRSLGEIFLSIQGSCSECGSRIHIYCPAEGEVTLHVSTFDSRGIAHEKKRNIRGERRIRVGKELQGKSTYAWRRDESQRLMHFGDVIPASLPTEAVARKAKQEASDKELGLFKVKSALASIWDLKYSEEFGGSIFEIGLDKFYVMFWTQTQLFLWKKFLKKDDIGSISIDATGSLVKQIPKPDGSKRVVYLYQAVCGYRGKILPLFQLISEKHDTNTLSFWMREWLRSGGSCPKQVVTDYSPALLNAVALAFNNCNLQTYTQQCILFDKSSSSMRIKRPQCIIRIDIAHLIKLITRWTCFNGESLKKDFYVRCIGYLTTLTKIEEFIETCTDIVSIARATHEDIDDAESHCFAAQKRIMNRFKTYDLPCVAEKNLENHEADLLICSDDFDNEMSLQPSSAMDAILKRIEAGSIDALNHGRLNPYHCPDFKKRFIKLVEHFVLWTAVMTVDNDRDNTTFVGSENRLIASSARSEEYFRELKNLVFKKGKALRIDKYLVIHLRSLEGACKLLNAPEKKRKKDDRKYARAEPKTTDPIIDKASKLDYSKSNDNLFEAEFEVNNFSFDISPSKQPYEVDTKGTRDSENLVCDSMQSEHEHTHEELDRDLSRSEESTIECVPSEMAYLNEIENWKGLNKNTNPIEPITPAKTKKRGKYLTACPDIEIIHKRPKFCTDLPLLANGNLLNPVKIGKKIVSVRNTCAFDSTVQSMLAALHDFSSYAEYISDLNTPLSEFLETLSTGVTAKLFEIRGCILSATMPIKNGVLDCEINISYLQEKHILQSVPSLEKIMRCSDCSFKVSKILPVLHLNPDQIYKRGMAGIQEALTETYKPRSTSTCYRFKSSSIEKDFSGGHHLLLNIEDVGNRLLSTRKGYPNCRNQFTVEEIPKKLVYDGYDYKFVSAIIYSAGHYFAFIERVTGRWEEHNDLKSKVTPVTARTRLQQHSIHGLFYVRCFKTVE